MKIHIPELEIGDYKDACNVKNPDVDFTRYFRCNRPDDHGGMYHMYLKRLKDTDEVVVSASWRRKMIWQDTTPTGYSNNSTLAYSSTSSTATRDYFNGYWKLD